MTEERGESWCTFGHSTSLFSLPVQMHAPACFCYRILFLLTPYMTYAVFIDGECICLTSHYRGQLSAILAYVAMV